MVLSHLRRVAVTIGAALSIALPGVVMAAPNLLANPGFDTDLSGWTNPFSRMVNWSSLDAAGSAASGSAFAVNDIPGNGGTLIVLSQCVAATAFVTYSYGGRVRVTAVPANTAANIFVQGFAAGDCTGQVLQQEA